MLSVCKAEQSCYVRCLRSSPVPILHDVSDGAHGHASNRWSKLKAGDGMGVEADVCFP